eukprot:gnl/MRDRNA2_/MRDRNA2_98405_c0_seq1.p1 gnl/MRDRNA2_/MRDRNA2_98405_c0~~gnl/MRDRNA2_/MRDRNA2_98405_c0_seq1.p1  ORF type:complete len:141 (-),score=6.93 gnl/MRDRNA2_/MRDRNA2_98405_c0_seq1:756-1178(-)
MIQNLICHGVVSQGLARSISCAAFTFLQRWETEVVLCLCFTKPHICQTNTIYILTLSHMLKAICRALPPEPLRLCAIDPDEVPLFFGSSERPSCADLKYCPGPNIFMTSQAVACNTAQGYCCMIHLLPFGTTTHPEPHKF